MRVSHEGDQPARMKTCRLVRHAEQRQTAQWRSVQGRERTEPRTGIQHTTARISTIRRHAGIRRQPRDAIRARRPQLAPPVSRLGNIQNGRPVQSTRKRTGIAPADTGWRGPGTLPRPPPPILGRIVIRPNETTITRGLETRWWRSLIGDGPWIPVLSLCAAQQQNTESHPARPYGRESTCQAFA
jgi:hypothetical protein